MTEISTVPDKKATKFTFKRYEKKFLLSEDKYQRFMGAALEHIIPDQYHKSLVNSIYYDTDDYYLIRQSLEKPVYKEKLRVRSYGVPDPDGTVFVELKKKYKGIVYKRRVQTTPAAAERWLSGEASAVEESQITREIDWFLKTNDVSPKVFVSCDRVSWKGKEDPELRFTFDMHIRTREDDLHLCSGGYGTDLLKPGQVLMEIKIPNAAPMWLAHLLSDEKIFPESFSKYGTFYKNKLWSEINA